MFPAARHLAGAIAAFTVIVSGSHALQAQGATVLMFYGGGLHIWKATAEETNGAFILFEDRMDFGKVTPLHIHADSDETMIVLEGEIRMHLDGSRVILAGQAITIVVRQASPCV